MSTVGGNVKELCTAASEGNLAVVKYHLDCGMNVNFQHPEFMTTPLIEASRFGKLEAVKLLLSYKADPTIVADWEGCTPMEEALREGHHDIVDLLLQHVPEDYDKECLTIWATGIDFPDDLSVIEYLLTTGHCIVLACESIALDQAAHLAEVLRSKTRNKKLFIPTRKSLPEFFEQSGIDGTWRPSTVDVWLHKSRSGNIDSVLRELESCTRPVPEPEWQIPFRGNTQRVLLWVDKLKRGGTSIEMTERQISLALSIGREMTSYACILEPPKWWEKLIYSAWSDKGWKGKLLNCLIRLRNAAVANDS